MALVPYFQWLDMFSLKYPWPTTEWKDGSKHNGAQSPKWEVVQERYFEARTFPGYGAGGDQCQIRWRGEGPFKDVTAFKEA